MGVYGGVYLIVWRSVDDFGKILNKSWDIIREEIIVGVYSCIYSIHGVNLNVWRNVNY